MSKSDDEDFRRNRRRRQNREAAQRCRQRKKNISANLLKEYQGLQSTNTQLLHEVRLLDRQRRSLNDCLTKHITTCRKSSGDLPSTTSEKSSANRDVGDNNRHSTGSTSQLLQTKANYFQGQSDVFSKGHLSRRSFALEMPGSSGNMSDTELEYLGNLSSLPRQRNENLGQWLGHGSSSKNGPVWDMMRLVKDVDDDAASSDSISTSRSHELRFEDF